MPFLKRVSLIENPQTIFNVFMTLSLSDRAKSCRVSLDFNLGKVCVSSIAHICKCAAKREGRNGNTCAIHSSEEEGGPQDRLSPKTQDRGSGPCSPTSAAGVIGRELLRKRLFSSGMLPVRGSLCFRRLPYTNVDADCTK